MKQMAVILALIFLCSGWSYSQCNDKVNWFASKAERLSAAGDVEDTKEGTITVATDSNSIVVSIKESPEDQLRGTTSLVSCSWPEPLKNGKTVLKAVMTKEGDADSRNVTITIEGKDGKITILLDIERMEGKKIRILVDRFEKS